MKTPIHVLAAVAAPILSLCAAAPDFEQEVRPILKANCISCHNKTTTKAELNLETPELMLKGGENGAAITPGKSPDSLLIKTALHQEDPHMPPKGNKVGAVELNEAQIKVLREWIDAGAKPSPKRDRVIAWEPLPAAFKGIYSIALTPDGDWAACSRGGQIFIYHVPTQSLVTRLTDEALIKSGLYKNPGVAHSDIIPALAFSPDGKTLASGSYREIKLWSREDIKPSRTLPANTAPPAAHPNPPADAAKTATIGDRKLTVEKGGLVRMTKAADNALIREFKAESDVLALAMTVDGSRLAAARADKTIRLWNGADGALIATLKGNRTTDEMAAQRTRFAAFLAEETTYHKDRLKAAEADRQKLLDRVKKTNEEIKTADAAIAPKQKSLADAAKADADAAKAAKDSDAPLAFGPPPAAVAKGIKEAHDKSADAAKKLQEAGIDLKRAKENAEHQRLELRLANEAVQKQDKAIELVKREVAGAEQLQAAAEKEKQTAIAAAANSQRASRVLAFSPDGKMLAAAAEDGSIRLWSAITGAAIHTLKPVGMPPSAAVALEWSRKTPDDAGELLATWPDGAGVAWNMNADWEWRRTLGGDRASPMNDRVNALRFSPDGKRLAAGSGEASRSGDVTIWEVATGKLAKSLPELHRDSVLSLDFSPDGKLLATGGADRAVKVLDTSTWKMSRLFEGHSGHVLGVAWRHEGRTLASAGAEGVVKIWDYLTGDRRKNLDGWEGEVTSIQFAGFSPTFAASSADKRVRLRPETGGEGIEMKGSADFMQAAAVSADGQVVIGGGSDGVLRVWDGETGKQAAEFAAP